MTEVALLCLCGPCARFYIWRNLQHHLCHLQIQLSHCLSRQLNSEECKSGAPSLLASTGFGVRGRMLRKSR